MGIISIKKGLAPPSHFNSIKKRRIIMTQNINGAANVGVDPIVLECINHLSGAHSALFWDVLYGTSESILAMENTAAVLAFLYTSANYIEAVKLIRADFELLGIEWPEELVLVERVPELAEPFASEFIPDAEDIISDYKYEEEITAN